MNKIWIETRADGAWEITEYPSGARLERFLRYGVQPQGGYPATAWAVSRCATEGCEGAGTEKLGDIYVCSACYQAAFQRAYDREREMGR